MTERNFRKTREGIVVSDKMDKTVVVRVEVAEALAAGKRHSPLVAARPGHGGRLHRLDLVSLSLFTLVARSGSISKGAELSSLAVAAASPRPNPKTPIASRAAGATTPPPRGPPPRPPRRLASPTAACLRPASAWGPSMPSSVGSSSSSPKSCSSAACCDTGVSKPASRRAASRMASRGEALF